MICPFCGGPAECVGGLVIYPRRHDLAQKHFWRCEPCDAYVGCHGTSTKALGTLADSMTRTMRLRVHEKFDPLWKDARNKVGNRNAAYRMLAEELQIKQSHCHIAMFNIEQCQRALKAIQHIECVMT